ncbi:MAG TPA: hypothetical protein VF121_02240 [Thermoanaerobaculia bacterium]|nr:hypothetical protein [Thermoanaerobaculia bacterium]
MKLASSPALLVCLLVATSAVVPRPATASDPFPAFEADHRCFPSPLRCGETRTAIIDATECFLEDETFADLYTIPATAGQSLTIKVTSAEFRPAIRLFSPLPAFVTEVKASNGSVTLQRLLEASGDWRISVTTVDERDTGSYTVTLTCSTVPPPPGAWLTSSEVPGFRFKVRVTGGGRVLDGVKEGDCIAETLCVSADVPGRPALFLRVVGPRFNGYFWPTIVKFTTSQVEVWIEQVQTGSIRYYVLSGANPSSSELPGFFDRTGFLP